MSFFIFSNASVAKSNKGVYDALSKACHHVIDIFRSGFLIDVVLVSRGNNVKKVYQKAILRVHPDKVQQKGATVKQKYIAGKVFDLLKVGCCSSCAEPLTVRQGTGST